jgi:alpha,alpha-trehalase
MTGTHLFFIESLSPLYEDIQLNNIFADSKYFVDSIPKFPAADIIKKYNDSKTAEGFNLEEFVKENFTLPEETISNYSSAKKTIDTHLNDLWEELKRKPAQASGTLIALPYEYIVPGGRFREIYYWDSYFTMLGLQVSKRIDIIEHMVDNFTYLINEFGFIPNGNRSYYLGRSQPPFFALMIELLCEENGEAMLTKYLPALEKEYQFWMKGSNELNKKNPCCNRVVLLEDAAVMNRYWDSKDEPRPEAFEEDKHIASLTKNNPAKTFRHIRAAAESGWDFSSRWFSDCKKMETIHTTDLVPVDLNCLLLHTEQTLLKMYQLLKDQDNAILFETKIKDRIDAIQNWCWNERKGCYFDYNVTENCHEIHFNLATVFPLFSNIATTAQAQKIATLIQEQFLHPGGLITTLYDTGQQWDAPNGWAPLQWMAYKGLQQYGFTNLSQKIRTNWMKNCEKVFADTGKMMEKYNVMDTTLAAGGGEYPNQDGFGWTNGVYLKMKAEV